MIRADSVGKRYGDVAVLDGVSFRVEAGERVAVLGMNGAGKTTLFRCFLGLTPFEGSVTVDGLPVAESGPEARARIGYVPQRAPVSDVPLLDFVTLFSELRGTPLGAVDEALEGLGLSLEEDGEKPLSALSGGMLQKSLLALALAADAPVLMLDEPTANLDPVARNDFLGALGRVDRSRTILLASHRLSEVEALADRILVLHRGGVAFQGSLEELRRRTDARSRLWVEVPEDARARARELLAGIPEAREVRLNGRGVWVDVDPGRRGGLLADLARAGVPLGEVRTEDEPLTRLLGRLGGGWMSGSAGGPAGPGEER